MRLEQGGSAISSSPWQRTVEWCSRKIRCRETHQRSPHTPRIARDGKSVLGCWNCNWMPNLTAADWRNSDQQFRTHTHAHPCVCMIPKHKHPSFHLCMQCGFAWPKKKRVV